MQITLPTGRDWRGRAECRGMDVNLFFPGPGRDDQANAAKAVCNRCPVRAECLADALALGEVREGIRGGLLPHERLVVYRARGPVRMCRCCGEPFAGHGAAAYCGDACRREGERNRKAAFERRRWLRKKAAARQAGRRRLVSATLDLLLSRRDMDAIDDLQPGTA